MFRKMSRYHRWTRLSKGYSVKDDQPAERLPPTIFVDHPVYLEEHAIGKLPSCSLTSDSLPWQYILQDVFNEASSLSRRWSQAPLASPTLSALCLALAS